MIDQRLKIEADNNLLTKANGSGIIDYTEVSQDYIDYFNSGDTTYWNPSQFWEHALNKYSDKFEKEFKRVLNKYPDTSIGKIKQAYINSFRVRIFNGSLLEAIVVYLIKNSKKYNFVDVTEDEDRIHKFDMRVEKIGTSYVARLQVKKFKDRSTLEENIKLWEYDKEKAGKYLGVYPEYIFIKFSNAYEAERKIMWNNKQNITRTIDFKNTYCRSQRYLDSFEAILDEMFDQIEQSEYLRVNKDKKAEKSRILASLVF